MFIDPKDYHATVIVVGLVLTGLQVGFAWRQNMLTLRQIVFRRCILGDIVLTLLAAYIASAYGSQWSRQSQISALALGLIVCGTMHWYAWDIIEDTLRDRRLAVVSILSCVYMAAVFAILELFYFSTRNPSLLVMWCTTGILIMRIATGNLFAIGLIKPSRWSPEHWVTVIVCGAFLILLTYSRVGI